MRQDRRRRTRKRVDRRVKSSIRSAASEADTAQAAAFVAILARRIADVSLAVESAELLLAEAKRSKRKVAVRRAVVAADDVRAERDELRRQVRAILRRFPSFGAQHDVRDAVSSAQRAETQ